MRSVDKRDPEAAYRRKSSVGENDVLVQALAAMILATASLVHHCELEDRGMESTTGNGDAKQTAPENPQEEPKKELDRHIGACVQLCNASDALLLCNACCARPLCPYRLHRAAQELSTDDARMELIAVAKILQENADLAPVAAHCIQEHVYAVSLAGRVVSVTIPVNDPVWSDQEAISTTASKFLELSLHK